tara:strand:- start:154356 stop:154679 length:324 start_codon:yes stop_codon:yes gene_type:complete
MAYGLIDTGRGLKSSSMQGMKVAAEQETNRNIANTNIEQMEDSAKSTNAATGATTGAMIGAQAATTAAATTAAGGVATGIGAMGMVGAGMATGGIGLVAGLLLSELI